MAVTTAKGTRREQSTEYDHLQNSDGDSVEQQNMPNLVRIKSNKTHLNINESSERKITLGRRFTDKRNSIGAGHSNL